MNIKALRLRVGQNLLLASCLAITVTNAFVAPSIGRACHQKIPCSLLPNINSVSLPRTNSISVNSAKTIEAPSPFAKLEKKRRLATGMAFLTGMANLALFMKYKTFATMMTGNTMWMAVAMVEQRYMDVAYYASVIGSYLAGLSIFRQTDLSVKDKELPICAFLVASLFVGSDLLFKMYQSRWIPMMMLATGFGIINSAGQEVTGTLTFVITGHMTRLTNQVVDRISTTAGRKKWTLADKQGLVQNIAIISGFFGGAAFAGVLRAKGILMEKIGVFSGIGLAYAGLFLWKDVDSLCGAWWNRNDEGMCDVEDDGKICGEPELPTNAVEAKN
jgi:uncharacterized membrane protein YoaK (UPF0700 family)